MKKQMTIFYTCLIFFGASLYGETGGKGPFFWEVEKAGKFSYILGTIHLGVALEDIPCSEEISSRLENASAVLTESSNLSYLSYKEIITFVAKEYENRPFSTTWGFKDLSQKSRDFLKAKFPHELTFDFLDANHLEKMSPVSLTFLLRLICLLNSPPVAKTVLPLYRSGLKIAENAEQESWLR